MLKIINIITFKSLLIIFSISSFHTCYISEEIITNREIIYLKEWKDYEKSFCTIYHFIH
jgi:hypothetical protein